ncbi:hypothetical protein [Kocuria sediminis]
MKALIETMRSVTRGFRDFDSYRLRPLPAAGGHGPRRETPTHAQR